MDESAIKPPESIERNNTNPVVFKDGHCGFCNGSVRFVLKHERECKTLFAPIEGETGMRVLKQSSLPADIGNRTIVLFENGQFLIRSRAALRTMELMGGGWQKLSRGLKLVPRPLADRIYDMVAKIRRKLPAGQSCALLPAEQRKRFLP